MLNNVDHRIVVHRIACPRTRDVHHSWVIENDHG